MLQMYLDGLSKAALPQHLAMDEVGWAEDAVRPVWNHTERLRSIDILPLGDGGCCVAGAWWLINAVAPPGGWEGRQMGWGEESKERRTGNCAKAMKSLFRNSYVMMRDLKLLMSGLGGWVMGRVGLGPSDRGVDRGPSTWSSASEEPPSCPWLWGSCSMVSCSSRLVSWISRSIWGEEGESKIRTAEIYLMAAEIVKWMKYGFLNSVWICEVNIHFCCLISLYHKRNIKPLEKQVCWVNGRK